MAGSNPATPTMITYLITSIICTAGLFFYNIKKRFTVKITYVLLFLGTYALLNSIMHEDDSSNIYFAIMFAFPSLFVSMMFTGIFSEPLSVFSDGVNFIFEMIQDHKPYSFIVIAIIVGLITYFN